MVILHLNFFDYNDILQTNDSKQCLSEDFALKKSAFPGYESEKGDIDELIFPDDEPYYISER